MKPENLMFANAACKTVKVVDFGSACTDSKTGFKYVQSRFYRCPEVVMGLAYDHAVDMWSLGCILCELCTGRPIFPAQDENELLEFIKMRIGMPPLSMIQACSKKKKFFDSNNNLVRSKNSRLPYNLVCKSLPISEALFTSNADFTAFIEVS